MVFYAGHGIEMDGVKKHARRAKLYPALVVLGIYDRCTPKLASDASRAVAMLSSTRAWSATSTYASRR